MSYKVRIDDTDLFHKLFNNLHVNINVYRDTKMLFQTIYGIKLVSSDGIFEEMIFKSKAAYILFKLEWS
jgi:hypothetical protein